MVDVEQELINGIVCGIQETIDKHIDFSIRYPGYKTETVEWNDETAEYNQRRRYIAKYIHNGKVFHTESNV